MKIAENRERKKGTICFSVLSFFFSDVSKYKSSISRRQSKQDPVRCEGSCMYMESSNVMSSCNLSSTKREA